MFYDGDVVLGGGTIDKVYMDDKLREYLHNLDNKELFAVKAELILNGYSKTGITIMYMSSKMDAGDIISQKEIEKFSSNLTYDFL